MWPWINLEPAGEHATESKGQSTDHKLGRLRSSHPGSGDLAAVAVRIRSLPSDTSPKGIQLVLRHLVASDLQRLAVNLRRTLSGPRVVYEAGQSCRNPNVRLSRAPSWPDCLAIKE